MVKERPILFSGPMVRAILEGRKTQTRWVAKQLASLPGGEPVWSHPCPHGIPGDRLWVKETWQWFRGQSEEERRKVVAILERFQAGKVKDIVAGALEMTAVGRTGEKQCLYAADFGDWAYSNDSDLKPWKSSMFMPRWASRITLEITAVRIERLQEITEENARAEGCVLETLGARVAGGRLEMDYPARNNFIDLWDSLNAKRGYDWEKNPWVWVLEFKRA